MIDNLKKRFLNLMPDVDYCSFRYVSEARAHLMIRGGHAEPYSESDDAGVMITVHEDGGAGYAATADLSEEGLLSAIKIARQWADVSRNQLTFNLKEIVMPAHQGAYKASVKKPFIRTELAQYFDYLSDVSSSMKASSKPGSNETLADWWAGFTNVDQQRLFITNQGADIVQQSNVVIPFVGAVYSNGLDTITRSNSGGDHSRQQGLDLLDEIEFKQMGLSFVDEARMLLNAPNCPEGEMDLLLDADQMLLQIHESIGHPLELDRILGDERNYAGTSFVTLDMFGFYQYGSKLLNVSFDPGEPSQLASYDFDDDGVKAEKVYLIKDGLLLRPLGSAISQQRAEMAGVANSRSCSWNRPPIDRMANINVDVGDESFTQMVSKVEKGIYMRSNQSWSIDDSRNKFQFGCQWGRLIENGKLTTIVKKPNYRGVSSSFWRSLKAVGDASTRKILGTPFCGKGEPNQVITVGHASPACLFSDVSVFGGHS